MERRVTGKPITTTLTFRVDLATYREIVGRARAEDVSVSKLLRRVVARGFEGEAAAREEGEER